MSQARVTSIEAIQDFKQGLATFCEAARDALCMVQLESRRLLDWIEYEQLPHWERQIHVRTDEVAQARNDLFRRKLQRVAGREPDLTEQKEALRAAQDRLEEAEQKVRNCRVWYRSAQSAIDEYTGLSQRLAEMVEGDPPPPVALLERIIAAVDSYLAEPASSGVASSPPQAAPARPAIAATPARTSSTGTEGGTPP